VVVGDKYSRPFQNGLAFAVQASDVDSRIVTNVRMMLRLMTFLLDRLVDLQFRITRLSGEIQVS